MELGIFAKTYERASVEEVFAAVAADGFTSVHFNFSSAGLPSLPETVDGLVLRRIRDAAQRPLTPNPFPPTPGERGERPSPLAPLPMRGRGEHGIAIETLSGTFN